MTADAAAARAAHVAHELDAVRALFVGKGGVAAAAAKPCPEAGMSEEEYAGWTRAALMQRARSEGGGDGFTERLREEVKLLCRKIGAEKSVMVVRLVESFNDVGELFAAEHRTMDVTEGSPSQAAWYANPDLAWLASLRAGLTRLLALKNLDRRTRVVVLNAVLLGLELFGQELLVERSIGADAAPAAPAGPDGKAAREAARQRATERGKWVVLVCGCAKVEVAAVVSDAVRAGVDEPPQEHAVPLAIAAARVLEHCVAFLLDDEGEAFECHASARWAALSYDTVQHVLRFLSEAQQELLWYFQETKGRVATDRDVALYPLLVQLMAEFDDGKQNQDRQRACAMLKQTGVLGSVHGLAE
eukprot:TRINITY_DN11862_c0_g7_i1.p1 TRINITY_DN11862_c0_g7~~TRINITY_DN11862_c0_g7_i1.p1  ORF type:complete len:396 (+),score=142.42 TRINITY_DN11862_c0_g7_i1:113-1189(+)